MLGQTGSSIQMAPDSGPGASGSSGSSGTSGRTGSSARSVSSGSSESGGSLICGCSCGSQSRDAGTGRGVNLPLWNKFVP